MKLFKFFIISFFIIKNSIYASENVLSLGNLKKNILGDWYYQYSLLDSVKKELKADKHCPVYRMVYTECNDTTEIMHMPITVQKMRKENELANIKCVSYIDSSHIIDTNFPVVAKKDSSFGIANYGLKYKSYYRISKIPDSVLIVYDGKVYELEEKRVGNVKHVYLKNKSVDVKTKNVKK